MQTLKPHLDYRQERLHSEAAARRQAAEVVSSAPVRAATIASGHRRMRAATAAAAATGLLLISGLLATSFGAPESSVAASVGRASESEQVTSPVDDAVIITTVPAAGAGGPKAR